MITNGESEENHRLETTRLAEALLADLDSTAGGCSWWLDEGEWKERVLVNDYLIGSLLQLRKTSDLRAHHLREFNEKWCTEQWEILRAQRGRRLDGYPRNGETPLDERRRLRLESAVRGYFDCAASSLDLLAACVIGIGGLNFSIREASWSNLLKCRNSLGHKTAQCFAEIGSEARSRQETLIRELFAAEPLQDDGWLIWTRDLRHTLLHRAGRIVMNVEAQRAGSKVRGANCWYVLPAHPSRSDAEEMTRSTKPEDMFLGRHAGDIMRDVDDQLSDLLLQSIQCMAMLWSERKAAPRLIPQPAGRQWDLDRPQRTDRPPFVENIVWPRSSPLQMSHIDMARWAAVKADDEHVGESWGTER